MSENKPVTIYVDMVADLFHSGHINFLKKAKELGDKLIVGIHSDEVVASYKRTPVMTMQERIDIVESCKYVDKVIANAPLTLSKSYLDLLEVDFVCHGDDLSQENIEKFYGKVRDVLKLIPYTPDVSTTNILERITQRAKTDFISPPLEVDFVAYHDLQAQTGESVFEEMSKHFKCNWRIGPKQEPSGAQVAIMLDHTGFQPNITKQNGYKFIFSMMHDMGDYHVFAREKQRYEEMDIVFTPMHIHTLLAQEALGKEKFIYNVGWPKYEKMDKKEPQYAETYAQLERMPYNFTILYAPTWADNWEWMDLLPLFEKLECNVILKNHIYLNPGQAMLSDRYVECFKSCEEMEKTFKAYNKPNIVVAPRTMNICSLFQYSHMAISDKSSVLIEFLPFGISIETGRSSIFPTDHAPDVSALFTDVNYIPIHNLKNILSSMSSLITFLQQWQSTRQTTSPIDVDAKAGKTVANLIDRYIYFNTDEYFKKLINRC